MLTQSKPSILSFSAWDSWLDWVRMRWIRPIVSEFFGICCSLRDRGSSSTVITSPVLRFFDISGCFCFIWLLLLCFDEYVLSQCEHVYSMWIVNCEMWIVNCELWIVNCELCIVNCELWIVNCELCTLCELWIVYFMWIVNCELCTLCELWNVNCELWNVKCELWNVKCELWIVNY